MKNTKKTILPVFLLLFLVTLFLLSGETMALTSCIANFTVVGGVCVPLSTYVGLSDKSVGDILTAVMQWLLYIVGTIAVIAFVISGIQYLTAAGSEDQIEIAKRNMKWSVVGITVVLSGLIIINFVDAIFRGVVQK